MAADTNLNQFAIGNAVGDIALAYFGAESVISCRYNASGTGTLEAGEGVKLVDLGATDPGNGPPIVDKRATDLEAIYGVVVRSLKSATFSPGDVVEIAIKPACMWLKAAAALNRGAKVSLVQATPGSIQAIGTKAYAGYLLDKAAQGDKVRVSLECDAVTAGS